MSFMAASLEQRHRGRRRETAGRTEHATTFLRAITLLRQRGRACRTKMTPAAAAVSCPRLNDFSLIAPGRSSRTWGFLTAIDVAANLGTRSMQPPTDTVAGRVVRSARRFLFVAAVAFWLGGFTFYTAVVIHVGHRALPNGHVLQGFVTQRVTEWLNRSAAVALPLMLWNTAAIWHDRGRWGRALLAGTWVLMAGLQAWLFAMHPALDRLLDARAHVVLDDERFRPLHLTYMTAATVQWGAGLLHVWCAVAGREV
jgi:hypothetical protein